MANERTESCLRADNINDAASLTSAITSVSDDKISIENALNAVRKLTSATAIEPAFSTALEHSSNYAADADSFRALFSNDPTELQSDNPEFAFTTDEQFIVTSVTNNCSKYFGISIRSDVRNDISSLEMTQNAARGESPKIHKLITKFDRSYMAERYIVRSPPLVNNSFLFRIQCIFLDNLTRERLRSLFQLTDAECEIAQGILLRFTIPELAKIRGGSIHTIRRHVEKIISKTKARNITQACLCLVEVKKCVNEQRIIQSKRSVQSSKILHSFMYDSVSGSKIQYCVGGRLNGLPLLFLHTMECSFVPPPSFFEGAEEAGYFVVSVFRPGFGLSTATKSLDEDTSIYELLMRGLGLKNFIVMAQNTAVPSGMKLLEKSPHASALVMVNFVPGEFSNLSKYGPRWMRTLLKLNYSDDNRLRAAIKLIFNVIRIVGPQRFHDRIFLDCQVDKEFCRKNEGIVKAAAERFIQINPDALALNVKKSIAPLRGWSLNSITKPIIAIRGADSTKAFNTTLEKFCTQNDIPYLIVHDSGRFCVYQKPKQIFSFVSQKISHIN